MVQFSDLASATGPILTSESTVPGINRPAIPVLATHRV